MLRGVRKMPDREKVIREYEDFVNGYECFCSSDDYEYEMHKAVLALLKEQKEECERCGTKTCEVTVSLQEEIARLRSLLKEQEAELSFREAKAITHTATKLDDATCPSCGNVVGEKIRAEAIGQSVVQVQWDYCLFCGQKLDWEGR